MKRLGVLLLLLNLLPNHAFAAWWNDDWGFKKRITIDSLKLNQDNVTLPAEAMLLIRLHTGNFLSFTELSGNGKDIRLVAGDDNSTPLKFYIEKIDPVNEMAFIWVKLPREVLVSADPSIWLYYGNEKAVDGQDISGTFDSTQTLLYPFSGKSVKDVTANANNPSESTNTYTESGQIGEAAVFQGSQIIRIPAKPSLAMLPESGWTVSLWLKIDQAQSDTVVFQRNGTNSGITLALKDQSIVLETVDTANEQKSFQGQNPITPGTWHNVVVVSHTGKLNLYLDGQANGEFDVNLGELTTDLTIGADNSGVRSLSGMVDQLSLYKVARDANAIRFDYDMQGNGNALVTYGDDVTPDSEEEGDESYFIATLDNVTIDGWVIIGILGIMFVISWVVMIMKTIIINRTHRDNKKFEAAFSKLSAQEIAKLDTTDNVAELNNHEPHSLFTLASEHGQFSASSVYKIYHVGVEEMNKRIKVNNENTNQLLSAGSMAAVKASMDAVLVRELQKLNSQMVLLTIAISGGPFLGLLGTVVGVMITFAAIAVNGEVNVNSIAPGIAAALTATVAGLAVAIPALFGYNYIGSRIKVVAADMQVFVDEFIAKLAEQHT